MASLILLSENNPAVRLLCKKDKRLAKVVSMVGEISYVPHEEDPYSFLIHEIIEQMLSIKAGEKIFNRLIDLCGGELTPAKVSQFTKEQIQSIGTSSNKAKYILGITDAVISGSLVFEDLKNMEDMVVIKHLTRLKGIGSWTAKMYLIFVLDRPDVLPFEDIAFLQAYKWAYKTDDVKPTSIKKRCAKWKPYSSIAARYLYRALDGGLTKQSFHLFK